MDNQEKDRKSLVFNKHNNSADDSQNTKDLEKNEKETSSKKIRKNR